MDLPLIVDAGSSIPLYQQLKYQIVYLISSRQLPHDAQLPSIRELAESLQINIGTVAQAYRELQADGLIESVKGRGTFVRSPLPSHFSEEASTRQEALTRSLTRALSDAFSLGFTAAEIQQRLASLLSQEPWACHLLFVGPTPEIASKHAALLEEGFGEDDVHVHPLDVAALGRGDVGSDLSRVHYVITFLGLVHGVEEALSAYPTERSVLAVPTRVSEYTLGALAILPSTTRACLISEEHNLPSALNLVATHSRLPRTLPTATLEDPGRVADLCRDANLVVHTFSSTPLLDELKVPDENRLELRFVPDPDALRDLRQLIRPLAPTFASIST